MRLPDSYRDYAPAMRQHERARQVFGLPPSEPAHETFRRFGGYDVHIDVHEPESGALGTALLVHGAGANGRLLAPFAAPFLARGLRVLAPDLPGYGVTRGDTSGTRYDEWIALVAELARDCARTGPVVLFGLSVGGMTALRAAQQVPEIRAVIATTLLELSDAPSFDRVARTRALGVLARWAFRAVPGLTDRMALPLSWLAPLELLTTDRALARLLARDPLLGGRRIPLRFMRSLHAYRPQRADYDLACPLLLVHPGADLWTPPALSLPVLEAVRTEKELSLLSAGSHAPLEPPAFAELCAAVDGFLARHGLGRDAVSRNA